MRQLLTLAVLAVASAAASAAWATIPSDKLLQSLQSHGEVNDYAGILSSAERAGLEEQVVELRRKTGAQFAVVTLKSLEGGQINDFTNKLFAKWGVGEKGKNNGLMLLVAIEDRKAWVEVGYGLEPILPDALAGRVLDEQLFPAFKQQHYAQGLSGAVSHIAEIIERGEPASAEERTGGTRIDNPVPFVLFLSMFVAIGFAAIGAGVGGRQGFLVFWGLFFGGIPLLMTLAAGGLGFWLMISLAATMFAVGWARAGRGGPTKPGRNSGASGWTWAPSGYSGGFSGGGFSGGGGGFSGGGGFGGGCSGGGGAGGGW
jgi:uncharacterized protein